MTRAAITIERVLDLIAAYGAEPGGWPEAERDDAQALIVQEPDAFSAALADARALDAAFATEFLPEPSPDIAARILATAPGEQTAQTNRESWLSRILPDSFRWPTGAALASMSVGLIAGYSYAGDVGFEAYLETESSYVFEVEDSFESWLDPQGDAE